MTLHCHRTRCRCWTRVPVLLLLVLCATLRHVRLWEVCRHYRIACDNRCAGYCIRPSGCHSYTTPPFPSACLRPQEPNGTVFFKSLFTVLRSFIGKRSSNLSAAQQQGHRDIRNLSYWVPKDRMSDKGGDFVVLSQELNRAVARSHLHDLSVYTRSSSEFKQYRRLNKKWVEVARSANLPQWSRRLTLGLLCARDATACRRHGAQ